MNRLANLEGEDFTTEQGPNPEIHEESAHRDKVGSRSTWLSKELLNELKWEKHIWRWKWWKWRAHVWKQ